LPLEIRRRTKAIGGNHRGNTATKNTSYGAYEKGGILPSREYYKRKPQGATTEKNYKQKLLREVGAVNYSYENECLILTSQFRCSSGFKENIE